VTAPSVPAGDSAWPGRRLGLPRSGPRSVGRLGRRIGALAIDWAAATLVSVAFFSWDPTATLVIFVVAQVVFVIALAGSPGHLITGLRVVPMKGGWIGPLRPLIRALLLAIVVPALIWDVDQRGLHDRLAGTVLVRF